MALSPGLCLHSVCVGLLAGMIIIISDVRNVRLSMSDITYTDAEQLWGYAYVCAVSVYCNVVVFYVYIVHTMLSLIMLCVCKYYSMICDTPLKLVISAYRYVKL